MPTLISRSTTSTLLALLLLAGQVHAGEPLGGWMPAVPPVPAITSIAGLDERLRIQCAKLSPHALTRVSPRLLAFTNGEIMADMLAEPAEFARLMEALIRPRNVGAMMSCAPAPVVWDSWIATLSNPEVMSAAASRFTHPGFFARWMMAPFDAEVQQSAARMMDPAGLARWSDALSRPGFYAPIMRFMDPGFYTARVQWLSDEKTFKPFTSWLEPADAE
jgi:hypothetical protein